MHRKPTEKRSEVPMSYRFFRKGMQPPLGGHVRHRWSSRFTVLLVIPISRTMLTLRVAVAVNRERCNALVGALAAPAPVQRFECRAGRRALIHKHAARSYDDPNRSGTSAAFNNRKRR
jgi:hypothetical protein